jgi:transcriptional regulator with XRE-family HTH domain
VGAVPPSDRQSPAPAVAEAHIGASLGRAIREARTGSKLTMRALAAEAEISQPFLSQIESGAAMPSIVTLFRIAKVLGISPSSLLPSEPEPEPIHLTRRDEGHLVPVSEGDDAAVSRIISAGAAHAAAVQEYRIARGPYRGEWFESDGENTVYVVAGELTVTIEGRGEWTLGPGDALAHPGALRNRWEAREASGALVLLVHAAL